MEKKITRIYLLIFALSFFGTILKLSSQSFALENIPVTGMPTDLRIRTQGSISSGSTVGHLSNNNFIAASSYSIGGQIIENGITFGNYWYEVDVPSATTPPTLGPYCAAGYPFSIPRCYKPIVAVGSSAVRLRTSRDASVTNNYVFINGSAAFIWPTQKYVFLDSSNLNGYWWYRIYVINECSSSSTTLISQPIVYCAAYAISTNTRLLSIQQPDPAVLSPVTVNTSVTTSATSATVTWSHNIDDADGYNVAIYQNGNFYSSTYVADNPAFNLSHSSTVTGLNSGTQYSVLVQPITNTNCYTNYSNQVFFTTTNTCSNPTQQASNIYFTNIQSDRVTLNWSNGNGSRRVARIHNLLQFSNIPDGTDPSASTIYNGSFNQVVYNSNGNSVTVTGLQPNTPYWFNVTEANCSGSASRYCTANGASNPNSVMTSSSNQAPIANFVANKSVILINQLVQFTDLSTNNPTSWKWEFFRTSAFGNNVLVSTRFEQNPLVTFNPFGCYLVKLTATNASGSNEKIIQCYVYVKPDPSWQVPPEAAQTISHNTYYDGDPVNTALGYFTFLQNDISSKGVKTTVSIDRVYTSNPNGFSSFGIGWFFEYDMRLIPGEWQTRLFKGDGSFIDFEMYPNGGMESRVPLLNDSMNYINNGIGNFTYNYFKQDGTKYVFNNNGYCIAKVDLNGNTTLIIRNGGAIEKIVLPGGREILFTSGTGGYESITNGIHTGYYFYSATGLLDSFKIDNNKPFIYKYNANNKLEEIIAPNGFRITKNEYQGSKVIKQWDAYNYLTQFLYDVPAVGSTTIINSAGKSKVVKHDPSFKIVELGNEIGGKKRYVYTTEQQLDSIFNERNFAHKVIKNNKGNILKTIDPFSNSDTTTYTNFDRPTKLKDKEGNETSILYDVKLNPIEIVLANGGLYKIEHNQFGQDTTTTDPLLNKIRKRYNAQGDLGKIVRKYSIDSLIYDAIGRPIVHINGRGFRDSIYYNYYNKPTRIVDQLGFFELFEYDANGNLVKYIDKENIVTKLFYDAKDRLIKIEKAGIKIKEYVWDNLDFLIKIRDANNNCTLITNDDLGRPIVVADSVLGILAQYGYDAVGNRISYTNSYNQTWLSTFDPLNRPIVSKNPIGDSTITKYNKNNQTKELIDELGKSVFLEYNSIGIHTKTIDKKGNSIVITPNLIGLPVKIKDGRGFDRDFTYDEEYRPKTYNEGYGNHQFFYDSANNLTEYKDIAFNTIQTTFNERNEGINQKWNGFIAKEFSFNKRGDFVYGKTPYVTHHRWYNDLGFIVKDSSSYGGSVQYNRDYNGNNVLIKLKDGKEIAHTFNSLNACTSVTDWSNRTVNITNDKEGNPTEYIFPNGFKTIIERNNAYQITGLSNIKTNPTNLVLQANKPVYNKRGDFQADTSTINYYPTNPIGASNTNSTYGAADRRLTLGALNYTSNNNGSVTNINGPSVSNSYTYNPDNTTNSINHYGIQNNEVYNVLGHRVWKASASSHTRYTLGYSFADYPIVLQEMDFTNSVTATNLFTPDGILLGRDSAGTFNYFQHTAYGNTSILSDLLGNITNTYAYGLFGNFYTQTGTSTQPNSWQGMYGVQKDAKDLYYMWNRFYDANTGSFLTKDPLQGSLSNTKNLNPYIYGFNDPSKYSDPNGLYPSSINNSLGTKNSLNDLLGYGLNAVATNLDVIGNIRHNDLYWIGKTTGKVYTKGLYGTTNFLNKSVFYGYSDIVVGNSVRGLKKGGGLLGGLATAGAIIDAYNNGLNWNNGLDIAFGAAGFIPGIGWAISGGYFIANTVSQIHTGKTIGERIQEK